MKDKKTKTYKTPKIEHWQVINLGLFVYDIFVVNAAFFLGLKVSNVSKYSSGTAYGFPLYSLSLNLIKRFNSRFEHASIAKTFTAI